jgi:CheY-like chemotaxis protein
MSRPLLLLVDDSPSVLDFERATLGRHHEIATAADGREGLVRTRELRPAAILLDLSMPEIDGDEMLARLKADEELRAIPVIIVSSEKARADACLARGASAVLHKPVRAEQLLETVGRVLAEAAARDRSQGLSVLSLAVGGMWLAVNVQGVESVHLQPATIPLPSMPSFLAEAFELRGEPVPILDLAMRLGLEHTEPRTERKLVVVGVAGRRIALCVDHVTGPDDIPAEGVTSPRQLIGAAAGELGGAILGVVQTDRGAVAVIEPEALLSRQSLTRLPAVVAALALDAGAPTEAKR